MSFPQYNRHQSRRNFLRNTATLATAAGLPSATNARTAEKGFAFDGAPTRAVLENYLDHSVTMAYFLVTGETEGGRGYPYREDDIRLIENIGAKFIGRAIYRWNGEGRLNDPTYWSGAKELMARVHAFDPDVIFQACIFETISEAVNSVPVPAWVFEEFGLPVEERNFSHDAMLNESGTFVRHWGRASVPDVSRLETRLWFFYLAGAYIGLGCEAIHLGQIHLIGMNDHDWSHWASVIERIRAYAAAHARRKWILLDAHTPRGGMLVDGVSLLDFNSFPLRVKEVTKSPMRGVLETGHLDSLYGRSKGCHSPAGWRCDSLPYLVEFDNFGRSPKPGEADLASHFVWGYDEISWFSLQEEAYRNEWLYYAHAWVREHDANGHLQMPVSRMLSCPNESQGSYRANTPSDACPYGYGQETTIKALFTDA